MLRNLAVVEEAKRGQNWWAPATTKIFAAQHSSPGSSSFTWRCAGMHICSIVWIWGWIVTLTDFTSKGLKFPLWRQLVWNCSFPLGGCFTSPKCSKQDTQWHCSVCHSRSEALRSGLLLVFRQHLSPGLRAAMEGWPQSWDTSCVGGLQNGLLISARAWASPSPPLFSLPFTFHCHWFAFALWPL